MSHIPEEDSSPVCFRIVDLFAGPGGLDVAAHVLGHEVTGIEWDEGACATRRAAGMDTFKGDVRDYRAAFFPRAQVLTGGPPCQTFTVAGHGVGRKALDQVLRYIERLHEAVRAEDQEWKEVFRTWRKISEELRRKELQARDVRAEKRVIDELRITKRKAIKSRLEQLGNSATEVRDVLKRLRTPERLRFSDDHELKGLFKEFSDLNDEHNTLRERLEELGDERTGLVLQPLWWVIERSKRPGLAPYEAVVLEQVPAVMPVWEEYAKVLASLGYRTRTQMMHTEAFGVPQTRRRAVLMARLRGNAPSNGLLADVPETHERYQAKGASGRSQKAHDADTLPLGAPDDDADPKEAWVSMEKALERARKISPNRVHRRPAYTVVSNYGTGGVPEARGRRDHDAPSATITGKVSRNRLVHKGTDEDLAAFDRFTHAEAGALQTFPVEYPWRGNDVSQQIGNAVPPRLALHVLCQVLEPELSAAEAKVRLKQAVADLEVWKPDGPVDIRGHRDLKGHQLARTPPPVHP
ncbi:DNA cytosine methyltransferase [Streptomyces sp. NPDC004629]|uniref:DNA cytosine methyltransferase n=1 Tax=Streptomyces sp. NPDC004629 TaxID=3364705 RepID=UPI0036B6F0C9